MFLGCLLIWVVILVFGFVGRNFWWVGDLVDLVCFWLGLILGDL